MFLRPWEICVLRYMSFILLDSAWFLSAPASAWEPTLKESKEKVNNLTDIDMLLKVEKCMREGI